jgi:uncharacterized protein YbjT (DUF2867 family)
MMKVLLFGATGMIGQGVLRECFLAAEVEQVVAVVRAPSGLSHPKLQEIIHGDFLDFAAIEDRLCGLDACFFCLGVSAAGMTEAAYSRVTYGFTLAAAATLVRLNPAMTFIYVSGQGTDGTEKGRILWARVKGRTENALLRLPFKTVCSFRPGIIQPLHGATSKTQLYRVFYRLFGFLLPLLQRLTPDQITSTQQVGRAMLRIAREGAPKQILEIRDFNAL